MASADKKKWTTPKLRVFVRTEAEERVLITCKNPSRSGSGMSNCKLPGGGVCETNAPS